MKHLAITLFVLNMAMSCGDTPEPKPAPPPPEDTTALCEAYCAQLERCETLPTDCVPGCIEVISDPEIEAATEFRSSISDALEKSCK